MADTFTQCYFHIIFSPRNREALIKKEWQNGYGAFTHSKSQVDSVVKYVLNQENHHGKRSFKEEYLDILRKNDLKFKDEYVFDFFEDIKPW